MDKYKTKTAFNKWVSAINLENLSIAHRDEITKFNHYQKKLPFDKLLKIFLLAIHEEQTSYHEMATSFVAKAMQDEFGLESISYSQLSRKILDFSEEVLWAIFYQLVEKIQLEKPLTKRNHLYLVDSSTIPLNQARYPWAEFRTTKSGVKLHLKLCFMDDNHWYPEDFSITHANEHDENHLEIFVVNPEATYVYDRGYLNYRRMDQMHQDGHFFVTRLKKNSVVHVLDTLDVPEESTIMSDQLVTVGSKTYLTARFRLVTVQPKHGNPLRIITNRHDWTAQEVADAYKSRWQVELFFKHIKQHLTIKKCYSTKEVGVIHQMIIAMISCLLTFLIKLEIKTGFSHFQIKRYFTVLIFESAEKWLGLLRPT